MTASDHLPTALPDEAWLSCWRAPDGWEHRRFDWPSQGGRGRVLVQGGRSDVVEKYLGVMAHLHGQGWSITSFDWRGQGGSGRLGQNPAVGHADRFAVCVDDLAAFWDDWVAERSGPHVLLAHSMGAHFALQAMIEDRVRPDATVLSAPMVQVRSPLGQGLGGRVASWMARTGDPSRGAWEFSDESRAVEKRLRRLTVDKACGQDSRWWEEDATLRLGPPSWGWIAEAFRAGAALVRDPRLAQVAVPTLFLIADADQLVDPRAALKVAGRMPAAEIVRFGAESAHEILREGPAVRGRAFSAIDEFLDRKAPA
ncbi:alpha/beta fold hydrolase [Sphingomonas sp.]|jgi:lysophospholipase|uniref:alpha/beta fold hydrolase n=1 Tax=Sphingomonas sp. TaxID=28214 RepID=UPI002D7E5C7D|nr:alpha/beta fold hydrolase [Sphingomonas sp.]HEU0044060.1 alpha/beta fold hydrolase [Sphingomonas sp.]